MTCISREAAILKVHPRSTLHLPDRPAGAWARGRAPGLGREQRLQTDRCSAGAPTAPVLAQAHLPQGGQLQRLADAGGPVNLGLVNEGQEVFVPFSSLLPMVAPDDLVSDGWAIIVSEPGGGDAVHTGATGKTAAAPGSPAPTALRLAPRVPRG